MSGNETFKFGFRKLSEYQNGLKLGQKLNVREPNDDWSGKTKSNVNNCGKAKNNLKNVFVKFLDQISRESSTEITKMLHPVHRLATI